jgi:hypothetical protein
MGVNRTVTLEGKGCFGSKCFEQPVFFKFKKCHYKRSRNRTDWNTMGHIFCCMMIKINFLTHNVKYTEINIETISKAVWNITADLNHVQMYILTGGPVRRIPERLYGRRRFCYQNTPLLIQVSFLKFSMFCSFFCIFLPTSVWSTFLSPRYWHKIIPSWPRFLIACKCPYRIYVLYLWFQVKILQSILSLFHHLWLCRCLTHCRLFSSNPLLTSQVWRSITFVKSPTSPTTTCKDFIRLFRRYTFSSYLLTPENTWNIYRTM